MTTRLRVVLDTNVPVSGLVFGGGLPGRLRAMWQRGVFVPLASTATVQELARVLVSGDKDLLALAGDFEAASRCRIVRMEDFLGP